ncbi:hypothetical protein ACF1BE_32495 [Streptomyces sp. NPDC014991]|uniref:hypothetical protein n=1 Tax=Streptomyces sp. NPDC014991 TaxID=3364935 RepID=UPI0036F9BB62
MDHTTAGALYDPKDPCNEAVAAFYVQASGGLGDLYAPVLSLTVLAGLVLLSSLLLHAVSVAARARAASVVMVARFMWSPWWC